MKQYDIEPKQNYEEILADSNIDAVVLVTPNSQHVPQTLAAIKAGKHVFCEKPFSLDGAGAQECIDAAAAAGLTLGVGYSRRFHPEMIALGLTPMGVHAIDGMIDMVGEIDEVYCQSFRRAIAVEADDTTSILFRMKDGCSGYLGTMTATGGGFNFQVYGSKGFIKLEGMTHIKGAPSIERRMKLFDKCTFKPVKGPAEIWQAAEFDVVKAALESFADAATGGKAFLITPEEMVHGSAVTEAVVKSAAAHQVVKLDDV